MWGPAVGSQGRGWGQYALPKVSLMGWALAGTERTEAGEVGVTDTSAGKHGWGPPR